MSCQCYRIGGPFIAEDPDCLAHGREARWADELRVSMIHEVQASLNIKHPALMEQTLLNVLDYLRSLS